MHIQQVAPAETAGPNRCMVMPNKGNLKDDPNHPVVYQIRLKGHLDDQWTDWFEGLTITLEEEGDTLLTGLIVDQAALFGLLKKVRDLGLPLVSINCAEPNSPDMSSTSVEKEK
jgi:hypothetical protein